MRVKIIVCVARNGVIGNKGALVFRDKRDMDRFVEITMGHAVVMGRKTWESIPPRYRPLPGRRNVVISRDPTFKAEGAEVVNSYQAALSLLRGEEEMFVIGGGELYEVAMLSGVDKLYLTEVRAAIDGDTYFCWEKHEWHLTESETHTTKDGVTFYFREYIPASTLCITT